MVKKLSQLNSMMNEGAESYSKVAQALEKVFPLLHGTEYYLSSEEFKVAFTALADTIKALRTENRDTIASSLKKIEQLVSNVISTHSNIENKADKSIELSDKVLADYRKTIDTLNKELSSFKDEMQNKIDSVKDGEDAKPEDVVPLVLKEIKFPEVEADELKNKLESLKGEDRLDSSAIKNLPEAIQTGVRGVRTKVFTDGTTITGNGTLSDPLVAVGAGTGDVTGPATNTADYIPQWDGADSKTLKNGIPTSTFAPALGADDNYVTDAEKIVIGNTSGTNTGDQTLPTRDSLGLDTDDSPQFAGIELGHASDTTIARVGAGQISVEGVNVVTISSTDSLTNKTFGAGTTTLASNAIIDVTVPTTDGHITGPMTDSINSGYTAAAFDLVFLGSGGKWLEVDADAVATCKGMLGIALEAKNDTQAMKVALPGSFIRNDTWNWTVGATLYAGETLGAMQEAIPTGADAIIRVVGFAVDADTIFFMPSSDQQSTVA